MEQQFWHEKWQANEIGFHQETAHPLLAKYFPTLQLPQGACVFVPLCGKSRDMLCLRDMGYAVLGLELSDIAVKAFFAENRLQPGVDEKAKPQSFSVENLQIVCGDFFSFNEKRGADIAAVFDRAALIALPPEMRVRYVEKMKKICIPGTQILLISLEYPPGTINSPPHAVLTDEVSRLYENWCDIDLLEKLPAQVKGQDCFELAYRMRVRQFAY